MSLKLYDYNGNEMYFDEVTENLEKQHGPLSEKIAATDMDGTMATNDIGVLVFLEKLGQPTFWTYSVERFNKLLLPQEYDHLLRNGLAGQVEELPQNDCRKILTLKEDIVKIYDAIHAHTAEEKSALDLSNPLINEFARKMILLDDLIIKYEDIFQKKFDGQLLMRTRFFADKNKEDVARIMKKIASRTPESSDSSTNLQAYTENIINADQQTPLEDVSQISYPRVLKEIKIIRDMLSRLNSEHNTDVFIITTNLVDIAEGFVSNSDYQRIIHPDIVATNLRKENGRYHPQIEGKPVFGFEKQNRLKGLEKRHQKNAIFAAGDSARNDWPMMQYALENNGIAIAVGAEFDRTKEKFHNHGCFDNISQLGKHIHQRILFALH